ncbi:MAG: rhodanese-like domain-containing protein [Proteobacteria bacterium]|nr:rhodanese-like domain-containing protein [Pseudomonadota bacterium]
MPSPANFHPRPRRYARWLLGPALVLVAGAAAASELSPDELLARLRADAPPLVLDVRTAAEYEAGHIPGARWIPHSELGARSEELAEFREREIVVYCERGGRAARAVEALRAAGFSQLTPLAGHMTGWRQRGLPLETGPAKP